MLTTQSPPRSELYESHHTENLEVEAYNPQHVITLPDDTGAEVEINLNDYDPIEADMLSRRDSFAEPPVSAPKQFGLRRPSLVTLEEGITETQLISLAEQRVTDLQRQIEEMQKQLKTAEKTKLLIQNPDCRKQMVGLFNERRTDELGRQRLELARRIRGSLGEIDL